MSDTLPSETQATPEALGPALPDQREPLGTGGQDARRLLSGGLRSPVAVVGLGYTGLPLAGAFIAAGRSVLGLDTDPARLAALRAGRSPLVHLDPSTWREGPGRSRLWLNEDAVKLADVEAVFLCLPTPLGPGDLPDLSAIEAAARVLAPALRPDQLVVLTSTSYPGTTRQALAPWLEHQGRRPLIAYSPEREDPGSGRPARSVPRLVAGLCATAGTKAAQLLEEAIECVIEVDSPEVAEAAKLFENTFRAVNIALANELKRIVLPLGLDPHAVIAAAASKPFGFLPFSPGPGAGGHCIPVDPHYLQHAARANGVESDLIRAALQVNRGMPEFVFGRVTSALGERGLEGARVLLIGLSYKAGVADLREAPGLVLGARLVGAGAEVWFHDPYLPELPKGTQLLPALEPAALDAALVERMDLVVILTEQPGIDWGLIRSRSRRIVDTRGVLRELSGDPRYWLA